MKTLCIVISTIVMSASTLAQNVVVPVSNIDNWCYQYKYDGRNRMTHKKLPGADWIYYVYDDRDRLVMTQNGEQRKLNQWLVTKYDMLNRPVVTAIFTSPGTFNQESMSLLISKTSFGETYTGTGITKYSNYIFPQGNLEVLTVTYYDNYSFVGSDPDLSYRVDQLKDQYRFNNTDASFPRVTGMVTGTKIKVLETPYYMTSVNYYDDRGRIVQTVSENYDAGIDRITNNYDFTGKVISTRSTHSTSKVAWKNINSVRIEGNKITRLPGNSGSAGAQSVQFIPEQTDGWVEATVTEATNSWRFFGLAESDPDVLPTSINYAFYLYGTNLLIYEKGTFKGQVPGGESTGDRLRIARVDSTVRFYRNGSLVYTSLTRSRNKLYLDVSLQTNYSTILNPNISSCRNTHTVLKIFDYDHAGRLTRTRHCVNNTDTVILSKNDYNELNQLASKKLHSNDDKNYHQEIDYNYNIRGWLTSQTSGFFETEILYNKTRPGISNIPMFNGNISAMRWRNNTGKEQAYRFEYDLMNRIRNARQTTNAFWEGDIIYDLNGNIKSLSRTNDAGTLIDKLTYDYGSGQFRSNMLRNVTDHGTPSGFADIAGAGDDYTYDKNGNTISDKNKRITSVSYNMLNLPNTVTNANGESILYFYDATGKKLSQIVKDVGGIQGNKTDYHGEFIYENDTLQFIFHEEGRVVMTSPAPEYQYHLKDHLGNVRSTFTTRDQHETSVANFESDTADFLYYNEAVKINSKIFDHTDKGTTHYSTRLNGSLNERIGVAKSLSVMPGDTVTMQVFAKYLDPDTSSWTPSLLGLISSIKNDTAPVGTLKDGGLAGSIGGMMFPWWALFEKEPVNGNEAPKAYLNWLVFDKDFTFKDGGSIQVSRAASEHGQDSKHEELYKRLPVKEAGFVYVYLSNDTYTSTGKQVEVYFDDFTVEHSKSQVIQSQDYYPFGLTYNELIRENSMKNSYQFGGKERESKIDLGWDDFGARMYSKDIGRWLTLDSYSESYFSFSPYNYVRNNPILRVDPSGRWDITVHLNNDREQYGYGIAVVTDRNGKEIFRFLVRAEGTGGRNRKIKNSDTPLGVYDIPDRTDIWRASTNDNRQTYGPNPRLVMNPESGEIVDTGRDAIRIHGGRQEVFNTTTGEWEPVSNPSLKKTHGCLRVYDEDVKKLKEITDDLMANDSEEIGGKVVVMGDFTDFLKNDGKDTKRQEETKTFWQNFNRAMNKGLDYLQLWLTQNGF